jgi:hypothetical protein
MDLEEKEDDLPPPPISIPLSVEERPQELKPLIKLLDPS